MKTEKNILVFGQSQKRMTLWVMKYNEIYSIYRTEL